MSATENEAATGGKRSVWANFKAIPLAERILGIIALLVLLGWIISIFRIGWKYTGLFQQVFPTLSFLATLLLAVAIILKLWSIRPLAESVERYTLAVLSVMPLACWLIEALKEVTTFLKYGGAIALAYIATTTYWRRHLPDVVTNPTGAPDEPPATEAPTAPSGEKAPTGEESTPPPEAAAAEGGSTPETPAT